MSSITPTDGALVPLLRVAEEAAALGSEVVARAGASPAPVAEETKGAGDYVTEVDRASEEAIRSLLRRATPDIPIHGEEEGGRRGERYWTVDPLDGTTNFLLRFPVLAVSVALVEEGRPVVGVVQAPLLGPAFSAARGLGAWADGRRLRVSSRPASRSVVAFGFPFRNKALMPRFAPAFERVVAEAEDVRRAGAAALDLAWVAAGVFDGYLELNLNEWDVAAGALLVEEAGGVVTDWDGGPDVLRGELVAGSPATHAMLMRAIREAGGRQRASGRHHGARPTPAP